MSLQLHIEPPGIPSSLPLAQCLQLWPPNLYPAPRALTHTHHAKPVAPFTSMHGSWGAQCDSSTCWFCVGSLALCHQISFRSLEGVGPGAGRLTHPTEVSLSSLQLQQIHPLAAALIVAITERPPYVTPKARPHPMRAPVPNPTLRAEPTGDTQRFMDGSWPIPPCASLSTQIQDPAPWISSTSFGHKPPSYSHAQGSVCSGGR